MGHWNYRVTRKQTAPESGEFEYAIREVYYGSAGNVRGWSQEPDAAWSDEGVAGLRGGYDLQATAFDRPVLDITDEDSPFEVTE